jgi:Rieske Fe-S protein
MKRRIFIEKGSQAMIASLIGFTISCKDEDIKVPDLGEGITINLDESPFNVLKTPNSWVLHPTENVILVNSDGDLRAFSSVCTHSQCTRNWVFGTTRATCTCHSSQFDAQGQVLRGPARSDLKRFSVSQDGNDLIIN